MKNSIKISLLNILWIITGCEKNEPSLDFKKNTTPLPEVGLVMAQDQRPLIGFSSAKAAEDGNKIVTRVRRIINESGGAYESVYRRSGEMAHIITIYGIKESVIINKILESFTDELSDEQAIPVCLEFYASENLRRNANGSLSRENETLVCRKILSSVKN